MEEDRCWHANCGGSLKRIGGELHGYIISRYWKTHLRDQVNKREALYSCKRCQKVYFIDSNNKPKYLGFEVDSVAVKDC